MVFYLAVFILVLFRKFRFALNNVCTNYMKKLKASCEIEAGRMKLKNSNQTLYSKNVG